MRSSFSFLVALALGVTATAQQSVVISDAEQQPLPIPKVGDVRPFHRVLQGPANPYKIALPVLESVVFEHGSFTQLRFDNVNLTGGSQIEITSFVDGDSQILTEADVDNGVVHSAYFNGPAVRVRLIAAGQAPAPSVRIYEVGVGLGSWVDPMSICGTADNRTLTAKRASARLLISTSGGIGVCSGWLISQNTGMATAGHCIPGATAITTQFNVPNSTAGGAIVNPAATSQYQLASIRAWVNGGPGNDYATYRTRLTSSLNPFQRQGERFTTIAPAVGVTHQRHGHGSASGTRNFAAKAHSGAVSAVVGTSVRYNTMDTTGGDSGSVVWRGTNQAVCVHTHGGCTSTGGYNSGTSVTLAGFAAAIAGVQ
jgi:V8-like Glu-specific endopeptidase